MEAVNIAAKLRSIAMFVICSIKNVSFKYGGMFMIYFHTIPNEYAMSLLV
jgi:hypothetical protein